MLPSLGEAAVKMQNAVSQLLGHGGTRLEDKNSPPSPQIMRKQRRWRELWLCLPLCGTGPGAGRHGRPSWGRGGGTLSHTRLGRGICFSDTAQASSARPGGRGIPGCRHPARRNPDLASLILTFPARLQTALATACAQREGKNITSKIKRRTLGHPTINHDLIQLFPGVEGRRQYEDWHASHSRKAEVF